MLLLSSGKIRKRTETLLVGPPGSASFRPEDGSKIQLPKHCDFTYNLDDGQSPKNRSIPVVCIQKLTSLVDLSIVIISNYLLMKTFNKNINIKS
jgi:hypothetical protein